MQFDDEQELEAFVFAVVVNRAEFPCEAWDAEIPEGVASEYSILRDFCGFMVVVGGHSEFGKAMACGLPFQPSIPDVEAFRDRAASAAERFDKMWLEAAMPF
ncbi:hypothetical protein [Rhizobium laguerreae]|uniref:hypothetical protein n=1 Tax=Rhizobium laguerreae TaxID=1076926 RepID=UPI001C90E20A|nr:hypothetical protein [Rhizobium laguerreae]MBY3369068.1 hypothetical protein [Rhizobium laguerreae]